MSEIYNADMCKKCGFPHWGPCVTPKKKQLTCDMWAYWCNERKRFYHVYETEEYVREHSPDGFKENEKCGFGVVVPVKVDATKLVS